VLYYCKGTPLALTSETCSGTKVCGWNTTLSYYGCVTIDGGAAPSDPSNKYPLVCP